ncbi:ABC transporter substrate-binding protein [Bradyrhizobium sp. CAR08]
MTISRRDLVKTGMTAGMALSMPSVLRAQPATDAGRIVRMVMNGDLRVFDPVVSTANTTSDHAFAIYDTLFGVNSKRIPQPQMLANWSVSDDKKTYTFQLRDGLSWHDGTPVTAADCVASIRRWAQVSQAGQVIMERTKEISKKDDKTFVIVLREPLGILIELLAAPTSPHLFMMREKDASRPASEQVTANIGSGPFKFNQALAKPGASFAYDRNEKYIPRTEPSDGLAGGKLVKIDRVVWSNIADEQTALAALQAGEIDFMEAPPADFYSAIKNDPNLELRALNTSGNDVFMRLNFLQPPFENLKARQAMLHLIDQEAFLSIMSPNPEYGCPLTSIFGNNTLYSNDENTGWYKKGGNPEKAKELFKEAGYSGEKIVILQPTNVATLSNACQFLVAELRKIGVNAELAPSDWGGIVTRRANKGPIETGGWSIFMSWTNDLSLGDPIATGAIFAANGDNAWYGWPKNAEFEILRTRWIDIESIEDRKALARDMQRVWWDFVGSVLLGQIVLPVAHRKPLTGLDMTASFITMWNMQKATL